MNEKKGKYGQAAKKSLGQNFLQDKNISQKIVNSLQINKNDMILEIGPGPGALTELLWESPAGTISLIEKDRYWAAEHANKYNCELNKQNEFSDISTSNRTRMLVFEADALKVEWEYFSSCFKCIGNLPYNIASPIMWDIFSRAEGLERAVFMIQREVGQRIVAAPGSKDYGGLSVWIQSFFEAKMEFIVPPHVFYPQPKVHSAVISFNRIREKRVFDKSKLSKLIKLCFQRRRKQLGTIFKGIENAEGILLSRDIDPKRRPETLSPLDFQELGMLLFSEKC